MCGLSSVIDGTLRSGTMFCTSRLWFDAGYSFNPPHHLQGLCAAPACSKSNDPACSKSNAPSSEAGTVCLLHPYHPGSCPSLQILLHSRFRQHWPRPHPLRPPSPPQDATAVPKVADAVKNTQRMVLSGCWKSEHRVPTLTSTMYLYKVGCCCCRCRDAARENRPVLW